MPKTDLPALLKAIAAEVPGIIALAIVDINTGLAAASFKNGKLDPEVAGAFNGEVIKAKRRAMQALRLENQVLDDIMITLTDQIHIIKPLADGNHFLYVAADNKQVNLGILRGSIRVHAAEIAL